MNERIEAVRKAQGLTQEQFAEKINLSRNYLWMLENGSRVPSDRTIKDICDKFGVCEEWLRTGEGEMTATDAQSDKIAMTISKSAVWRCWQTFSPRTGSCWNAWPKN